MVPLVWGKLSHSRERGRLNFRGSSRPVTGQRGLWEGSAGALWAHLHLGQTAHLAGQEKKPERNL